jgi:hypothetical protein
MKIHSHPLTGVDKSTPSNALNLGNDAALGRQVNRYLGRPDFMLEAI